MDNPTPLTLHLPVPLYAWLAADAQRIPLPVEEMTVLLLEATLRLAAQETEHAPTTPFDTVVAALNALNTTIEQQAGNCTDTELAALRVLITSADSRIAIIEAKRQGTL